MRVITLDIETKNVFEDVNSNDPAALDLSVVGVHDSATGEYRTYLEEELKNLWPILEQADILVTWNGNHFDLPILAKYYPGKLDRIKSLDLMKEVVKVLGRRLKLDTVASATLGKNKTGHGLDAIEWWRTGQIEKLKTYCIDDVKITREVYEYAVNNGHLKYRDSGTIREIKLDTKNWKPLEKGAMTFTLPF